VVHTFLVLVKLIFFCIFCQLDRQHHDHGGPLVLHHFSNDLKLQNSKNFRIENGLSPGVMNLTLKMTSTQVVETTVTINNSASQESTHQREPYFFKDQWELCVQTVHGCLLWREVPLTKIKIPLDTCHYQKKNNKKKNIPYLILWLHSLSL